MASTSRAVEEAAQRIQEMLKRAREDHSGVTLEVNEAILDSCTGLMKVIKVLIERSNDLQSEIVGEGMVGTICVCVWVGVHVCGTYYVYMCCVYFITHETVPFSKGGNMSAKEFYKKNSRWSEGLISASKQVGMGASVLV